MRGSGSSRRVLLLAAGVAALAGASVFLLSGAVVAGAATPCMTSLNGSTFEIDPDANLVVDDATCIDWLTDSSGSGFRTGVLRKNDRPSGAIDNSFGQGSQEDDMNPTIVAGSIPTNKSDLTTFGLYPEVTARTPSSSQLFWTRVQSPSGTTNMDFELNQKSCPPNCSTNGVTPRTHDRRQADHVRPLERRYACDDLDPDVGMPNGGWGDPRRS